MMQTLIRSLFTLVLALGSNLPAIAHASTPLPREVLINGVEFVLVPEGEFWYGVANGDVQDAIQAGRPIYKNVNIWLDAFYIAKFEARATDFKRFMDSTNVVNRSQYWRGDENGCAVRRNAAGDYVLVEPDKDLPVTHLSWELAKEFTEWMGFRLPAETEWVKAARGTDRRAFPWGDEYPDDTFASYGGEGSCQPVPVNAYSKGVSPYGAYNMAGNVYEYVADWYNIEHDLALKDGLRNPPLAPHGTKLPNLAKPRKVLKGGRWASNSSALTIYGRVTIPKDDSFICYGVRFAIDAAKVREGLKAGRIRVVKQ